MSRSIFLPYENESDWDHSLRVDNQLGFQTYKIEINLVKQKAQQKEELKDTRAWIGLHPQTLMTPYSEIYTFLNILKTFCINTIVDFGAGYCRVPIVMNELLPNSSFIGYEIVQERVDEARRVLKLNNIKNWQLAQQNILSDEFIFPQGDIYFIYDFSNPKDIIRILNLVSKHADSNDIFLIARGKGVRSLIQNKYPEFWACYDPIHTANWSLYSNSKELDLKDLSQHAF